SKCSPNRAVRNAVVYPSMGEMRISPTLDLWNLLPRLRSCMAMDQKRRRVLQDMSISCGSPYLRRGIVMRVVLQWRWPHPAAMQALIALSIFGHGAGTTYGLIAVLARSTSDFGVL